jgi:hypothetical protein
MSETPSKTSVVEVTARGATPNVYGFIRNVEYRQWQPSTGYSTPEDQYDRAQCPDPVICPSLFLAHTCILKCNCPIPLSVFLAI